ncbi:hypothetical protein Dimus_036001 [Dionaea muscipula]
MHRKQCAIVSDLGFCPAGYCSGVRKGQLPNGRQRIAAADPVYALLTSLNYIQPDLLQYRLVPVLIEDGGLGLILQRIGRDGVIAVSSKPLCGFENKRCDAILKLIPSIGLILWVDTDSESRPVPATPVSHKAMGSSRKAIPLMETSEDMDVEVLFPWTDRDWCSRPPYEPTTAFSCFQGESIVAYRRFDLPPFPKAISSRIEEQNEKAKQSHSINRVVKASVKSISPLLSLSFGRYSLHPIRYGQVCSPTVAKAYWIVGLGPLNWRRGGSIPLKYMVA